MLGLILIVLLFPAILIAGLTRPALGMIGFYAFVLLDPKWNWRWSVPQDIQFQKYIFAATLIGFLLHGARIPTLNRASKFGLISCVAFLLVCHTSSWSSIAPERSEFFLSILRKEVLCIFLTVFLLDSPHKIKLLLIAATSAQAYNAYQINLDYFQTGFSRFAYTNWGSYNVDNNGYSLITISMLGTSFAFALGETIRWRKFAFLAISVLQIHEIFLLASRGAMVAMVPMFALLIWKMPRTKSNLRAVALGAVATFILAGPSVVEEFQSSFAKTENRDSSAQSRFFLWKAGYRITMDHPLTGVGPDAARRLVPQARYYGTALTTSNKALHNLYFEVSTGTGIPGFVFFMFFILTPVWFAWRNYTPEDKEFSTSTLAVMSGSVGYLIASNFSSGITLESVYILTTAGYAIMICKHKSTRVNVSHQTFGRKNLDLTAQIQ